MFGAPVLDLLVQFGESFGQFGAVSGVNAGVLVECLGLDVLAGLRCGDCGHRLGFLLGRAGFRRRRLHFCSLAEGEGLDDFSFNGSLL